MDKGLDALKTVKVFHEAAEAVGGFIGNKFTDKIEQPKNVIDKNQRNVKEIIIPPEKSKEILNELIQVLHKWNAINYLNY